MAEVIGEVVLSAARGNDAELAGLLKAGRSANEREQAGAGKTALHAACSGDHEGAVALLLAAGADPLAQEGRGSALTPGHSAAAAGAARALRALLEGMRPSQRSAFLESTPAPAVLAHVAGHAAALEVWPRERVGKKH